MHCTIEYRIPTVNEYQSLRKTTGWEDIDDKTVAKGLSNSCFAVCISFEKEVIATGRIIGDGAMYFYIQDVIVIPKYKKEGLGKQIMIELEKWLKENAPHNAFIGLMAAKGTKDFYKKFNYDEREKEKPGMFKIRKDQKRE